MRELVQKLKKYEIKIRKAINSQMQGEFNSIFRGSGLEFDDIRPYQYGDDIRSIDWRTTAKYNQTYVKQYKETKEQSIFFLVDLSGSQDIGNPGKKKVDIVKEICAVLSMVALKESSRVGLITFTDQKESYVKACKGNQHAYEIISALFDRPPVSTKTDLSKGLAFALNTIKRRSIVIVISDFIDEGYEHNLKAMAKRHDLVIIHVNDKQETNIPGLGIIPVVDKETHHKKWVNTSAITFRNSINHTYHTTKDNLTSFCKKHQINYLNIHTDEDYSLRLIKLFKVRNRSVKRV